MLVSSCENSSVSLDFVSSKTGYWSLLLEHLEGARLSTALPLLTTKGVELLQRYGHQKTLSIATVWRCLWVNAPGSCCHLHKRNIFRITQNGLGWKGLQGSWISNPPHHRQGHQPPHLIPDQSAKSSIQPGLEHLQGQDIHNLSRQLFQYLTTFMVKNFPLTSNLNLPSFNLKPFSLVLLLSTLSKSSAYTRASKTSPVTALDWPTCSQRENSCLQTAGAHSSESQLWCTGPGISQLLLSGNIPLPGIPVHSPMTAHSQPGWAALSASRVHTGMWYIIYSLQTTSSIALCHLNSHFHPSTLKSVLRQQTIIVWTWTNT